jgi:hypothetical protein
MSSPGLYQGSVEDLFLFAGGKQIGSLQNNGSVLSPQFDTTYTPVSNTYPAIVPATIVAQQSFSDTIASLQPQQFSFPEETAAVTSDAFAAAYAARGGRTVNFMAEQANGESPLPARLGVNPSDAPAIGGQAAWDMASAIAGVPNLPRIRLWSPEIPRRIYQSGGN